MAERIALGLVGCGFFAQNHLHSWNDLRSWGVDIVAVCDVDPARAKAAAEQFGVRHWYVDPETMFQEEKLGLVDIVTRTDTHREVVELAIRHRLPTIVQKPFGPDLAACTAMAKAAEAAGVFLAVHENFRFQTPMRKATEALRSGVIGEPSWARISFRTGYDIYKGQPYLLEEERFVIIDLGVHVLDLARLFLGEAEHVSAETQKRNPRVRGEDTATMLIKHRAGGVSVVECTYEAHRLPDSFPETLIEIEGRLGALILKVGRVMELTVNGSMIATEVDAPLLDWAERPWHIVQESVFATCSHMLAAIRAGREADTSANDNLKTFALAEAAYEAAATGKAVRPKAG
jgi:predicted dehydrogenase